MKTILITLLTIIIIQNTACSKIETHNDSGFPILNGPYLGQKPPGIIPEVFAPGIVSTGMHEHSFPSFSPDGNQVVWTSVFIDNYAYEFPVKVVGSNSKHGIWSEPDFYAAIPLETSNEAFIAPSGKRVYFTSTSKGGDEEKGFGKQDIWYIEKSKYGWTSPQNLGLPVNTPNVETKPTVTKDLTLYYVGHFNEGKNNYGIYRSELIDGIYQTPELLPKNINTEFLDWTPFIAPDESYLLFSSFRPNGYGSGDLYISCRNSDDTWSDPFNLGSTINGQSNERYPYVSPDGKYLFFVSDKVDKELRNEPLLGLKDYRAKYAKPGNGWGDIYWVDAEVIEELRPN